MTSPRPRIQALLAMLSGWPRWLAIGGCLLGAALSTAGIGHSAGPGPLAAVLVTARPLGPGVLLTSADMRTADWPAAAIPAGAFRRPEQAIGRRLASQLAGGEPVASGALLEPAIAAALADGKVATTVRLTNPNQGAILRNGAVIDLYGAADDVLVSGKPIVSGSRAVATNVEVLAILPASEGVDSRGQPAELNLVVATDRVTAARLADHLSSSLLATLTRPP